MNKKVIGYCTMDHLSQLTDEALELLDIINLSFAQVKDGRVVLNLQGQEPLLKSIQERENAPRIVLSIGGWSAGGFSEAASTEAGRSLFASCCLELMRKYKLDGVDVDWEYPCVGIAGIAASTQDYENYTLLLREIREVLNQVEEKHCLLSIAAGGDAYFLRCTNIVEAAEYLDYVHIMTYDLRGGFQIQTGHHTNLYTSRTDFHDVSVDHAVRLFLEAGVPSEKLVIGAAYYSREWTGVSATDHGFLQMSAGVGGYGPDYTQLCKSYIDQNGYKCYWDEEAKAPYLYNGDSFISYDDERSVRCKAEYVWEKNLGGMMFWEYGLDQTGSLTRAMAEVLHKADAGAVERSKTPEWFVNAKLGIFIHYGIYAVKGIAESWSFYNGRISYEEYMEQLEGFSASEYDANKWADLIQASGARYAVLTTKHHDGVALFDSKYSNLNVAKKTPAGRDLVQEYADAVRARGIHVGMYYSLIDWSHPDYASVYEGGRVPEDLTAVNRFTSPVDGKQDEAAWARFTEFNRAQLGEVLGNYGKVDLLWFDGDWERSASQWGLPEFKEYLRSFNSELIINSRLQGYGDYKTPEQGLPITKPEGAWEFCTTINDSWGYVPGDNHYKSLNQILRMFCDCITMGGNMLLDIGPKADGTIDPRQEELLLGLGDWIRIHEEAVFGTGEGVMSRYYSGGSTISADKRTLYLFLYDEPKEAVCLKGLCNKIKSITVLHSGKSLSWDIHGGVPWFSIPGMLWIAMEAADCHQNVTVLKLELEGEIEMYGGSGAVVTHN